MGISFTNSFPYKLLRSRVGSGYRERERQNPYKKTCDQDREAFSASLNSLPPARKRAAANILERALSLAKETKDLSNLSGFLRFGNRGAVDESGCGRLGFED